ncbi:hypothetical protein [Flagellimonas sp. S3867]|uniref:hypothetical protein n=1 Tax=Flagellimonas sp. S3867 TaxID=2768063 RepID=UPI0016845869|nr:hypothetical protein [Flagellimonas sp. S3867]
MIYILFLGILMIIVGSVVCIRNWKERKIVVDDLEMQYLARSGARKMLFIGSVVIFIGVVLIIFSLM